MEKITNVAVFGTGVLGSQIAFQTAWCGFAVTVYDINEEALDKARSKFRELATTYMEDTGAPESEADAAIGRIRYTTDMADAVKDAQLAIEAIPENIDIKKEFYKKLGAESPPHTIFATNTSTLLPSQFAEDTGRPERFLALHFANQIWKYNTAEIMCHAGTDKQVFDTVIEFARSIKMVPLPIQKEQPGYILNSLLVPLLDAAMALFVNGISDPETIDKTWMIATGAPKGPFGIYDVVGITTAYKITRIKAGKGDRQAQRATQLLRERFIDTGKLGAASGEGFYKYPNPAYESPGFLK